ncbi:unnamed protein product [Ceratitis capitata]|uniref:(Mediterranean fruit fly) hypothetical protein n=1 Tax=Ceratitis capitata TaxID=7213 RepID=A0A811TXC9_CERCA|nr:unnamed protein product [Ceratitis capitata]
MYRHNRSNYSWIAGMGIIAMALLWLTALNAANATATAAATAKVAITTNISKTITNTTILTTTITNPQISYRANRKIIPNTHRPWQQMATVSTLTHRAYVPAALAAANISAMTTALATASNLISMLPPLSQSNAANYFTLVGKLNPFYGERKRTAAATKARATATATATGTATKNGTAAGGNAAVAATTFDSNPNTRTTNRRKKNKNKRTFTTPLNVSQHPGELCNRRCTAGDSRICHFKFTLEHYQVMGVYVDACGRCSLGIIADCFAPQCILADGYEKGVMSINRQLPGPAIQVCRDDLIIVDVFNQALGTSAAIHWHGQHMVATPWSDGVPFVTQCPIHYANTFRYHFWATEVGTHFYHSHSGHHKVNGQYGALIVRDDPSILPNKATYDFDLPEHYILISDWMHTYGEQYFPGEPSSAGIFPDSVLINGRGIYYRKDGTRASTVVPPVSFYVTPGKRYRFRLINSISHSCPFQLQIERHNMCVIASDSYDLQPNYFDTLISNAGERYDFVVFANNTAGDYWIRVRGMGVCAILPTESFALLRYISNEVIDESIEERPLPPMPAYNETFISGMFLDHPNISCGAVDNRCISELEALEQDELLRTAMPDHQFFLAFHNFPVPNNEIFKNGTYYHFANLQSNLTIVGAINNLSFVFPNYPPLTQPEAMNDTQFCTELERPAACQGNRLCPCVHRLHIRLGSIVELILVDETELVGRLHHPFHLHGHRFIVTALGRDSTGLPKSVLAAKQLNDGNSYFFPHQSNNTSPPFKDTVSIPSRGYAVVRFRAENPGFWLMHCHYEWHLAIGMGLILQVGNTSEMVKSPQGFPTCGNYLPELSELEGFRIKKYFM